MAGPVLVTGGAGFIGSHLVDRLLQGGREVWVVDDFNDHYDPAQKRANLAAHRASPRFHLEEGDIRDPAAMERLVRDSRPEVIVHLAARAGVRPSLQAPDLYAAVNVGGTVNLLEAARKAGVGRFVFGSSSSVYGLHREVPFREEMALHHPASPYAATKIAGEALCRVYAHLYDLSIVSLRFFTVYGPRQRPDLAIRKFAERIEKGAPIELFGDGSSSRDYTFVDDIVAGVVAAMDVAVEGHEVFNLGNSYPVSLSDLVSTVEQALGKRAKIERLPDQPGDVPRTFADISRAQARLGYTPQVSFEEGIARFVSWLRRAP